MSRSLSSIGIPKRKMLEWAGLAVAFVIALRPAGMVIIGRTELPTNDISTLEAGFSAIGRQLPSNASVGWLVPRDAPLGFATDLTVSRYALLPRRLATVAGPECASRGRDACGASGVDILLVPHWDNFSAAADAMQLGFAMNPTAGHGIHIAWRIR